MQALRALVAVLLCTLGERSFPRGIPGEPVPGAPSSAPPGDRMSTDPSDGGAGAALGALRRLDAKVKFSKNGGGAAVEEQPGSGACRVSPSDVLQTGFSIIG